MKNKPETYGKLDQRCANTIRMLAADAVQRANSGHPGLPLGAADIATVLWTRFLKNNPRDPAWPDRDRFVLSAGHGSAMLYALLHLSGYPLSLDELKNFRQWGSHTAGHPEYELELGIETTTGPLGQGLSNAVGMAIAERWLAARFNQPGYPIVDHYTYVIASDGDLMEGISHEVASLAGHLGLGKLVVYFDDNSISIDGSTDLTNSDDVIGRFEAYGWHTTRVDGHDMEAVDGATRQALAESERPSLIACRTHIGLGSPLQDTAKVHGSPLGKQGLEATKEHYDWPLEPRFYIPDDVQAFFNELKGNKRAQQDQWQELVSNYRQEYPELASQWDMYTQGRLPDGWEQALPDFTAAKPMATRACSGAVLDEIAPLLPTLLGGSADLTGSNKTKPQNGQHLKRDDFSGNYIHFGIREHGMSGIMNGLALHGVRPYGGTFLVFSDYLRPTIRLAAQMKLPVIYVFTHDSIGLGEDGPTHQPIEQLASLRVIPNLVTLRPADGNETAQAWQVALERTDGPTALILTRQGLPQITPKTGATPKGAYVLVEPNGGSPEIVLIATGSEVSLAVEASKMLAAKGVKMRVVSMPSWEMFEAQPSSYQEAVLPPGVPRLAIEAGATQAWAYYTHNPQAVIGLDRYGASAPYETIYEQLGLTAEHLAKKALAMLKA
jgi:transketolase